MPLSPISRHRLSMFAAAVFLHLNHLKLITIFKSIGIVKRKILVLDLDETLIHSHHSGIARQMVKPGTPPDFVIKVVIEKHPVSFYVHKRPHVDYFLDIVSSLLCFIFHKLICLISQKIG